MITDDMLDLGEIVGTDGRSQVSTKLDWGETPVKKGSHPRPLEFTIVITETWTSSSGDNTLQISVESCETESGTYKKAVSLPAIAKDELTKGTIIKVPLPLEGLDGDDAWEPLGLMRYVLLAYDQGGTGADWTAGKLEAYLTGAN